MLTRLSDNLLKLEHHAGVHIVFGVSYETLQTMCFRSNYC